MRMHRYPQSDLAVGEAGVHRGWTWCRSSPSGLDLPSSWLFCCEVTIAICDLLIIKPFSVAG